MNGKSYFGSTLCSNGVDELLYGERINIGGIQVTFAPRIFLQHALGNAHPVPHRRSPGRLRSTFRSQCLAMPTVTLATKSSAVHAAPSTVAICASKSARLHTPNYNSTKLGFVYFGLSPGNVPDKRNAWRMRASYREYNSTISCSLTIGCISSREGMCATLPLSASRFAVNQSGTGAIWVSSRLRRTS